MEVGPLHQTEARILNDCIASWHAVYVQGLRPHFPPFRRGGAVAAACEAIALARVVDDHCDMRAVGLGAVETWQDGPEPLSADGFAQACEIVENMTHPDSGVWFGGARPGFAMRVEFEFAMDGNFRPVPPGSDAAQYEGRIDRIDYPTSEDAGDTIEITDHKSGFLRETNAAAEDSIQGRVYSLWALGQFPGIPKIRFRLKNVRHGATGQVTRDRDDPVWDWTRRYLRVTHERRARAVETESFPETPGDGCGSACPIWPCATLLDTLHARGIPSEEEFDVKSNAALYLAAKATAASLKRDLEKVADDGEIDVTEGKVLGHRPGTKQAIRVPFAVAVEQLMSDGATLADVLTHCRSDSLSASGVRKVAAAVAAREQMDADVIADALIERVASSTFTTYAPTPKEDRCATDADDATT